MPFIGKKPTAAPLTSSDVADGIITNAKLAQDIISADTALGATPADTDEFLVSDAGVLKRMDYSHIKGGGKILQLVSATDTTIRGTTSTSYVTASNTLTVDITPSATSSKILVMVSTTLDSQNASKATYLTIYRDSSNLGVANGLIKYGPGFGAASTIGGTCFAVDSPSSTSSLTYQAYIKVESGSTGDINNGSGFIVAMEIDGS